MGEETKADSVTLAKMDEVFSKALEAKVIADELLERSENKRAEQREFERELQQYLEHFGKDKYVAANGEVNIRTKLSFRTPKTQEDKKAFFEHLQAQGIFWEYVGVNSNALNSYCKREAEIALEEGKDFNVPGIEKPTEYKTVHLKGK